MVHVNCASHSDNYYLQKSRNTLLEKNIILLGLFCLHHHAVEIKLTILNPTSKKKYTDHGKHLLTYLKPIGI